jgi:hypothetical protein
MIKRDLLIGLCSLVAMICFIVSGSLLLPESNKCVAFLGAFLILAGCIMVICMVAGLSELWYEIKKKKSQV